MGRCKLCGLPPAKRRDLVQMFVLGEPLKIIAVTFGVGLKSVRNHLEKCEAENIKRQGQARHDAVAWGEILDDLEQVSTRLRMEILTTNDPHEMMRNVERLVPIIDLRIRLAESLISKPEN